MRWLFLTLTLLAAAALQAAEINRVVIHVDEADPERQDLVLNNASNVISYYQGKGKCEEVEVEIVAYGPGLTMLIPGKSPVAERVDTLSQNYDNLSFRACANTHAKMSRKAGHDVPLMPQAQMVPSGVIHLIERQQQGWAYIRP